MMKAGNEHCVSSEACRVDKVGLLPRNGPAGELMYVLVYQNEEEALEPSNKHVLSIKSMDKASLDYVHAAALLCC
jgi:hypothetical protein